MAKIERKRTSTVSAAKPAKGARRPPVGAAVRRSNPARAAAPEGELQVPETGSGVAHEPAAGPKSRKRKLPSEISRTVRAALDKKAQDVVVLDLRHTPAFTDFFVLCSGLNPRQVKAIADAVEETLRAAKVRPTHVEGYDRAEWVLMDFFSFIVHVFTPQTRAFYALERLWGDAERIAITDEHAAEA